MKAIYCDFQYNTGKTVLKHIFYIMKNGIAFQKIQNKYKTCPEKHCCRKSFFVIEAAFNIE